MNDKLDSSDLVDTGVYSTQGWTNNSETNSAFALLFSHKRKWT